MIFLIKRTRERREGEKTMGIQIILNDNLYLGDLDITFYIGEILDEEDIKEFKELINSWYVLGKYEAFGGELREISNIWIESKEIGFTVDVGRGEKEALDILFCAIESLAEKREVIIDKIIVGNNMED